MAYHFASLLCGVALELVNLGSCGEGAEGSDGILQVQNLSIGVVLVIHSTQVGVLIQHGLPGFHTVILHQLGGNAQPHAVLEGGDFTLGVGSQLLGHRLGLSGLDVQLTLKDMSGTKGTNAGLITIHGGQMVNSSGLQKFTYFFHKNTSII